MSAETCARCGQLLLVEVVRQVGGGTKCPFCEAPLSAAQRSWVAASAPKAPPTAKPAPPPKPTSTLVGFATPAPVPPLSAARVTIIGQGAQQPVARSAVPSADDGAWFRGAAPEAKPTSPAPPSPRQTLVGTPPPAVIAPSPKPAVAPVTASAPAPVTPPPPIARPVPAIAHAAPQEPAAAMLTAITVSEIDDHPAFDGRRRRLALVGGAAALVLVVVIGSRHHGTSGPLVAKAPEGPTEVRPTAPPIVKAPPPAPEIGLDPGPAVAHEAAPAETPPPARVAATERPSRARAVHEHAPRATSHRTHEHHQRAVAVKTAPAARGTSDHDAAHAAYSRGNALLLTGDATGAIAAYREAVKLAPTDPVGYRGLGLAFEKRGETDDAIVALRRYLKLAPRSRDRDLVARRLQRLVHPSAEDK